MSSSFFFFNDPAPTEIYTLSLHAALPISPLPPAYPPADATPIAASATPQAYRLAVSHVDRKSTRLNSSHTVISYAVFCLKKKKQSVPPTGENRFTLISRSSLSTSSTSMQP